MKSEIIFLLKLAVSFLPFILFAYFNSKTNIQKEHRYRQYPMPLVALVYSIVLLIFLTKLSNLLLEGFNWVATQCYRVEFLTFLGNAIRNAYMKWTVYVSLILFNTAAMLVYILLKRFVITILAKIKVRPDTFVGKVVDLFYDYDEMEDEWFIKSHFGQARTFIKSLYYGSCVVCGFAMLISCYLCMNKSIAAPFYPVFAIIIIGEMAFLIDGLRAAEGKSSLTMQADRSRRLAMYPLLRKPLKALFGDKLSAEGTTVNTGSLSGGAIEDILISLQNEGGHIGRNYATFIRKKMEGGFRPNVDYVRSGYDLSVGKSLLFNTPFYDKLNPYVFYAMNRELLTGGKVLIVLGRHGTEEDLKQWSEKGMQEVSNIPELWKIDVLSGQKCNEEDLPDIGIISRSGVHDLDIHKNNLPFLRKVSFVVVVEPSRLVTTAQIGLNLLVKCCGEERKITFCSVDRNCDGLVDALSHILMTNITEVSATEYPHGMSSYMYWTADDDYLQHRILPGVSRFLGMGVELSMVALRNQVKKTVWYGGDTFPVLDARWIAKQYYHDLLEYAQLPANQETFDKTFQTSFNLCNERVSDYSFISVEDDRSNLFETRRNFATIAEEQGFVNVISSEYMLREYMSDNTELFTADAKAIPYITADYARTRRNAILCLCLLLCVDTVQEDVLNRQMVMLNIDTKDPAKEIWKEICIIFGSKKATQYDRNGLEVLTVTDKEGETFNFKKDSTILFKRAYCVESGKFESIYTIEDANFARIILDDLQNASYIAEQESKDVYIGTELKGHVYQKYLPGQFFTLNGKYYEMIATATDNRILVRRASEHIGGRLSYRQVRNYTIHHVEDSTAMGALKTVNNIDIHYQYADFSVETPGYWKLRAYNNFDNGDQIRVNGVPTRTYHHKQIVKFDFSKLGDAFTDSVRMTLTNLLNETFVTLFAENQPFISAITPGNFDAPITYNLELAEGVEGSEKCIYIVEDSQLDIGLLIAVERNVNRIFQIISDYLSWNAEKIEESLRVPEEPVEQPVEETEEQEEPKKKGLRGFFGRIGNWFKNLFKRKKKKEEPETVEVPGVDYKMIYGKPHKLVKGKWVACSQEEFDRMMGERHRKLDELEAQRKAEAEAAKAAEAEEAEETEETAEETESEPAEESAETADEPTEEESTEEPAEEAEPAQEAPAKKSWLSRFKESRKEKKQAKEEKKAAKKAEKAAKAAQKAEEEAAAKAEAEAAKEEIPAEPAAQTEEGEAPATETQEQVAETEPAEEAAEETAEDPAEQETPVSDSEEAKKEVEVSENE